MKSYKKVLVLGLLVLLVGTGMACGKKEEAPIVTGPALSASVTKDEPEATPAYFTFHDASGNLYRGDLQMGVPLCAYEKEAFGKDKNGKMQYKGEGYDYSLGVDLAHHCGKVNWKKVKEAGYDFAILRIGYRGYGKDGSLNKDRQFERNYEKARQAGLKVGAYFFAQAINKKEAAEEARFVLDILNGRPLDLPLCYDPESIPYAKARTDKVSGKQFTKNTLEFCERVKEAGYEPMYYCNLMWQAKKFDLKKLCHMPLWYADYQDQPQTPYYFNFWQYSESAKVPGVNGRCDTNIYLTKKSS